MLVAFTSNSQSINLTSAVSNFMQDDEVTMRQNAINELVSELDYLKQQLNKPGDPSRFLKRLFYKVQRDYLLNYENNVDLGSLFNDQRKFDCVTGTALYALLLDALEIDYSIKETDFHVYLLVHLDGKDLLFESTDPHYGYIDNPVEIGQRIREYRTGEAFGIAESEWVNNASPSDEFTILYFRDNVISLMELAGLQYYNLATDAFNNGKQNEAVANIEKAIGLYPNDRFNGFREILLVDMSQSMSATYSPDEE